MSAEKTSLQNDEATNSMFGSRSGGTAASNEANQNKVHSDTVNLIGQLQGSAASGLLNSGEGLLGQGISGTQTAFGDAKAMQAQRAAQIDDIFKSSASVAGSVLGALPANQGSWQDQIGNVLSQ